MAEVVGIITFGNVQLGTHDAYITTEVGIYATKYTVHCDYINTDDSTPFYIVSPQQRLAAETYLAQLATALNLTEMTVIAIGRQQVPVAPAGITPEVLTNEWSSFSADNCYCTAITHEDSGGRYYGFTVEFTRPNVDSSGTGGAAYSYKNIPLGNIAVGNVETDVSGSFNSYIVTTAYRGEDSATYIETVADQIGLGHIFKHDIHRGAQGNRGVVKSYDVIAGDLNSLIPFSSMPSVLSIFPEGIDSSEEAIGVLKLSLTFVKAR